MSKGRPQGGYTLLELVLVLVILGVVAAAAVPTLTASAQHKLELVAEEAAAAIRFARSESLRTGAPHGIHAQVGQNRIRVFRADMGTTPPSAIFDVYHPLSKSLYAIDLDDSPLTAAVGLASRTLNFRGACNLPQYVIFDGAGTPRCTDPASVILEQGVLEFILGQSRREVVLGGYVGRVSVQ